MSYGSEALVRLPDGRAVRERFAAFSFSEYLQSGAATNLNLQHDKGLVIATTGTATRTRGKLALRDHPDGLDLTARLPPGDVFDEVLALVSDGSTSESSVEFRARKIRSMAIYERSEKQRCQQSESLTQALTAPLGPWRCERRAAGSRVAFPTTGRE